MKNKLIGFGSDNKAQKIMAKVILSIIFVITLILVIAVGQNYTNNLQDDIVATIFAICMVSLFWIPYLVLSNIFNLRDILPLYKNRKLISTVIAVMLTMLIIFVFAGIATNFYTDEYKSISAERRTEAALIKLEQETLAQEKAEAEQLEQDRLEQERAEAELLEQERLEQERAEAELLEQERLEQERMEAELLEQERLEQEKAETEILEQEKLEQEEYNAFDEIKMNDGMTVFVRSKSTEGLIFQDGRYTITITEPTEKKSGDEYYSTYNFSGTFENSSGDYISAIGLNFCALDGDDKLISGYDAGYSIIAHTETKELIEDGDIIYFEASILISTLYESKFEKIGLSAITSFGY